MLQPPSQVLLKSYTGSSAALIDALGATTNALEGIPSRQEISAAGQRGMSWSIP
jgi:hypothetical protein